jgi:hypothetical protein
MPASDQPPIAKLSSRQVLDRVKRFAARLQANARWMKRFLHGGK